MIFFLRLIIKIIDIALVVQSFRFCVHYLTSKHQNINQVNLLIQGCIQKFLGWLPGVRTANGTPLCH